MCLGLLSISRVFGFVEYKSCLGLLSISRVFGFVEYKSRFWVC